MTKEDPEDPNSGATPDMWRHVIRPASSDSAMQPTTQIPDGTSKAIKQRLDQYLQELCSLMPDVNPDRIRERIVELAAVYHASVWDYQRSSLVADRRKCIRNMLATMGRVMEDAQPIFDTLGEMAKDDGDFFRGGFGETIIKFFDAILTTNAELQKECDKLGEPRQGERARAEWPPTQKFLLLAELLWMNETLTDPKKEPGYHAWLQLLFEIVTGEKERPLTRALADYRTRLRPVSRP